MKSSVHIGNKRISRKAFMGMIVGFVLLALFLVALGFCNRDVTAARNRLADIPSEVYSSTYGEIEYHLDGDGPVVLVSHGVTGGIDQGMFLANNFFDAGYDADSDGMPNLWEYEHGLDPNYPTDAIYDPDDDDLINRDEYEAGTDPFNPDTDGDGIIDGRDGSPTNYMRPTGGLIIFFSILAAGVLSSITFVIVKRVQRKKREFRETYIFCPKCSMKHYRATGVCIYCGEEIDLRKIETIVTIVII